MGKRPSWPHPKLENAPEDSEGSRHVDGNHKTYPCIPKDAKAKNWREEPRNVTG